MKKPSEFRADLAIIGGGTGGCAAALAALRLGKTVVMTEETDWIGGQLTAQAVPPDEHRWIEQFGCTASYRRYRDDVRAYYRQWYPMAAQVRRLRALNPGGGWVSQLCHEPRVGLAVLNAHLQPYFARGQLQILLETVPIRATTDGDRVSSVLVKDLRDGEEICLVAPYFLDATELGDVLELAGVEFVMGAESGDETGEPHAVSGPPQPLNQQSISWCFALSHHPGEDHTIEKPDEWEFWRSYQAPHKQFDWTQFSPSSGKDRYSPLFQEEGGDYYSQLWMFRQILESSHFEAGFFSSGITLVNWPQIDYCLGPLLGVPEVEKARNLRSAMQLSLCFLYWMQTEAPRPDGGTGYPSLRLRGDVCGTKHGLAKAVYIRESRRIKAELTVVEQHVSAAERPDGAEKYPDSVGIGSYRLDMHQTTGTKPGEPKNQHAMFLKAWPFQIPLGALIPRRVENLLPACKNLGVTHITNGCYRLHPVEWNIGEAAGVLVAHCLDTGESPRGVRNGSQKLVGFQQLLKKQGVELEWPRIWPM